MAGMKGKSALGRGLSGLISGGLAVAPVSTAAKTAKAPAKKQATPTPKGPAKKASSQPKHERVYEDIALSAIEDNPYQPREHFDVEQIEELAQSIHEEGLMQPIVVRKGKKAGSFILIAGERRLRAFKHLGRKDIPARVMNVASTDSALLSLIENLQRQHLNPMEEALGYASLIEDFKLTQEAVAKRIGKGRATVTNALRLLKLPMGLQAWIREGNLSVGHAKVLIGVKDAKQQAALAQRCVQEGLSVRQLEALVGAKLASAPVKTEKRNGPSMSSLLEGLQEQMRMKLGAQVDFKPGRKQGKVVITYKNSDHLHTILQAMGL